MRRYLIRRSAEMLLTFFLFMILTFVLIQAPPGDITTQMKLNPKVTQAMIDREVMRLGLDKPIHVQFFRWASGFFQGDWGESFSSNKPVTQIIRERLPRTIVLFTLATIGQFILGFHLGRVLAWRRGGGAEYLITIPSILLYTAFTPWFALVMILIFSVTLKWLPIGSFATARVWLGAKIEGVPEGVSNTNYIFSQLITTVLIASSIWLIIYLLTYRRALIYRRIGFFGGALLCFGGVFVYWAFLTTNGKYAWDLITHLFLPVLTLTAIGFAGTMLLMRTTMLETLREDYILTARAKGVPENVVRDKHAARNALLPVMTSLIIGLPGVISGGVFTETVFSWPGMGLALLEATSNQDIPLAMAVFTVIGALALLAHLVADIAYAYLDPRVRFG